MSSSLASAVTADSAVLYEDFLRAKMDLSRLQGLPCDPSDVNPKLKPHQRDIVVWNILGGRRADFAAFGLGKTWIQLETLRIILEKLDTPGRALIVCPLGVRREFVAAAETLSIKVRFVRRSEDVTEPGVYLTNYESVRDDKLDPDLFKAVSLDEASVLRDYGSVTYQRFLEIFAQVPYRFVATATPSPNRFKELIHYAAFLGIMDSGQALTRFFKRDSTKANNLTLYPHKKREFWLWLNSWAIFLQAPSDLGYSDEGYDLPPLSVRFHEISVDHEDLTTDRGGQVLLFRDASLGVVGAARERRATLPARVAKVAALVAESPEDSFVLWHDLEAERRALKTAIPDMVEIYGSLDLELREERIADFTVGKTRLLGTKPKLSGSGTNLQHHCHRAIFCGVGFKFNDFIQAIHRLYRFLQNHEVVVDIVYAESEYSVLQVLLAKWAQHKELTCTMSEIIKEHGLNKLDFSAVLRRSMGVERVEVTGNGWTAVNNDCVLELRDMASNAVAMILTSFPFGKQYEYAENVADFGHNADYAAFWEQMDYLTPELLRVLQPGRIWALHCKDGIEFGNVTGAGLSRVLPLHADAILHGIKHGFDYMGMITVVTDVVRENGQTYRLGWTEQCKDGSKMGVGSPEYVLLFHKPQTDRTHGYADVPVVKSKEEYTRARWQTDAHAFWRSSGNRLLTPEELVALSPQRRSKLYAEYSLETIYDYEAHVRIGEILDADGNLPSSYMCLAPGSHNDMVWTDVNRMNTLNTEQSRRAQANHLCPLQFDIVDRLIRRYTMEGELVFDPFAGLMTVPYRALKLNRRGYGVELNPSYHLDGVAYCQAAERDSGMPSIFDDLDEE